MNSLVFSALVTFGQPQGEIMPDRDAARFAARAVYKDLEWDKKVSNLEKKYLKLDKYPELSYIGIVVKIATEKRIEHRWEF